jgi:hypothetical protein
MASSLYGSSPSGTRQKTPKHLPDSISVKLLSWMIREEVDVMSERMVVSEEDFYEMLSFLVTSAHPTVHEPRLYGTLRLIDALPDS